MWKVVYFGFYGPLGLFGTYAGTMNLINGNWQSAMILLVLSTIALGSCIVVCKK